MKGYKQLKSSLSAYKQHVESGQGREEQYNHVAKSEMCILEELDRITSLDFCWNCPQGYETDA